MNPALLTKMYQDLPAHHRNRWSLEQFLAQQNEMVHHASQFSLFEPDDLEEMKLPPLESNEFGGLASAFNVPIDTWIPTIIKKGAFKNTLADHEQMSRVKVLWAHDHGTPIGVPTTMKETNAGLQVVGKISNTAKGQEVLTLMRDGVITEMSIGFTPTKFFFEETEDKELFRHVTAVELWEFSPVVFGANRAAKITDVNSLLIQGWSPPPLTYTSNPTDPCLTVEEDHSVRRFTSRTDGHEHEYEPGGTETLEANGHKHGIGPAATRTDTVNGHSHDLPEGQASEGDFEECVQGILDALAEGELSDGQRAQLDTLNQSITSALVTEEEEGIDVDSAYKEKQELLASLMPSETL